MATLETEEQALLYSQKHFEDVISCERLNGGLANYVYRLKYANQTCIMKYFAPHLSSDPNRLFPQSRYFIEKESLSVFQFESGNVKVPKLLKAVDKDFVLIMEDAGIETISLMDYLLKKRNDKDTIKIAQQVGSFLWKLNKYDKKSVSDRFENKLAQQTTREFYKIIDNRLKLLDLPGSKDYLNIKLPEFTSSTIIMGDLWPNSIYLNNATDTIWILDWEFARFGNGFDDIAQCTANLWLMKQSNKYHSKSIKLFNSCLIETYCALSRYEPSQKDIERFFVYVVLLAYFPNWDFKDHANLIKQALLDCPTIFKF